MIFSDRTDAGVQLAARLELQGRADVLVLALPRGGVPVAFQVAQALGAGLDVFMVRKLGVPGQEELALGAIASGGVRVVNRPVVESLGISAAMIEGIAAREQLELERRERDYRGNAGPLSASGKVCVLVDDGLATGSTMRAAARALRQLAPERIVVAVPVAPRQALDSLREEADEVVCLLVPHSFFAVGQFYATFDQTSDAEVRELLEQARRSR